MTTRTMLCTGRTGHFTAKLQYTIMEIQPGLEVMIVTGEDVGKLAESWANHLDETERRPGMADEPTPDEAAQLDEWAERDPHLARWRAYNVQPADCRDDWVGA